MHFFKKTGGMTCESFKHMVVDHCFDVETRCNGETVVAIKLNRSPRFQHFF